MPKRKVSTPSAHTSFLTLTNKSKTQSTSACNSPKKIKSESSTGTPRKKVKRENVEASVAPLSISEIHQQTPVTEEKPKQLFAEKVQTCFEKVLRMEQEHPDTWPLLPLSKRVTRDPSGQVIGIDWEGCYLDMLLVGEEFGEDEFPKRTKDGKKLRVQRSLKGTQVFDNKQIGKTNWDLLLEEMTKLASDFAAKRNTRKNLLRYSIFFVSPFIHC